jgi:hypothetical protein
VEKKRKLAKGILCGALDLFMDEGHMGYKFFLANLPGKKTKKNKKKHLS